MSQVSPAPTVSPIATTHQQFPWAGILIAICWSLSSVLTKEGLSYLDSPVLGVTVGMSANVFAYGFMLYFQRDKWQGTPITREALNWQVLAGILVGLATWARWIAIDLEKVAVVVAISRINVPIVLLLSIFMLDRKQERITSRLWLGAALILIGSMVLTFYD